MFLKSLIICNGDELIREINFHKGINLIIDETSSEKKTDSGNSVGKTTVLRLIDFCLDGKGENIYIDSEFKTTNLIVESFLKESNVVITLTLIEDIDNDASKTIKIQRNFLKYKQKIQTIDKVSYSNEDFSKKLKSLIFHTESEQPTFKQLKSKNIRDEKNKLINTIRVLAPNVVTDVTYEALHLFWFGIDIGLSKDKLVRDKNLEEKLQTRLRRESNLSQINQSLIIINKEIEELSSRKERFNLNEKYKKDIAELNKVKFEINSLSSNLSRLELREDLIIESKLDLEKDIADIDISQIKRMYENAKNFIPKLQKSFEDTLLFHNEMIQQKIQFIAEELPSLKQEIFRGKRQRDKLLLREKSLSEQLSKSGVIDDLQTIVDDLNSFFERKGKFEEQKRLWEISIKNLKNIDEKLDIINQKIYSKDDLIQKRIEEFNIHFSAISSKLDGIHSLLSADNPDGIYKFIIGNIEGNLGTGSKKSQMASFDLAYIKFADEIGIPCLHFVLQDQIENVHSNQITNLLTEIVSDVNCQYVLPVLRDKLPFDINIDQFEILSLSQNIKLFKL
jgi:uncharacterized protein YydD (DUF2326 family)